VGIPERHGRQRRTFPLRCSSLTLKRKERLTRLERYTLEQTNIPKVLLTMYVVYQRRAVPEGGPAQWMTKLLGGTNGFPEASVIWP
jgi:hypothetical protein